MLVGYFIVSLFLVCVCCSGVVCTWLLCLWYGRLTAVLLAWVVSFDVCFGFSYCWLFVGLLLFCLLFNMINYCVCGYDYLRDSVVGFAYLFVLLVVLVDYLLCLFSVCCVYFVCVGLYIWFTGFVFVSVFSHLGLLGILLHLLMLTC